MVSTRVMLVIGGLSTLSAAQTTVPPETTLPSGPCHYYTQTFTMIEDTDCNAAPNRYRLRRKGKGMSKSGRGKGKGKGKSGGGGGGGGGSNDAGGVGGGSNTDNTNGNTFAGGESTCSATDEFVKYWTDLSPPMNGITTGSVVHSVDVDSVFNTVAHPGQWTHTIVFEYLPEATTVTPAQLEYFGTTIPSELIFSLCGCTDTVHPKYMSGVVVEKALDANGQTCIETPPLVGGLHAAATTTSEVHAAAAAGSAFAVGIVGVVVLAVGVAVAIRRQISRAGYAIEDVEQDERTALVGTPGPMLD